MFYTDHCILSSKKFNCNQNDTLQLHKIMDSSKLFFPNYMHRMFSHNLWFVHVVTELVGDTITNTKNNTQMSVRDILWEHLREDMNGETPSLEKWMENVKIEVTPNNTRWFNNPRKSDLETLKNIKNDMAKV